MKNLKIMSQNADIKILFNKLTLAVELMVVVGLASCQHNDFPTPIFTDPTATQALREGISADLPKVYQLIKHGDVTLSYYSDGKLKKLSTGTNVRGKYPTTITYAYTANSIIATLSRNSKEVAITTYLLDPNTKQCLESTRIDYIPMGTNTVQEEETQLYYLYNTKGQLVSMTNKKAPNSKTILAYNAAGDLDKISFYGYSGNFPGPNLLAESTLLYEQTGGDPMLDDLLPVNCEQANFPDPYLKIFGKQSKHLVKMVTEKATSGGKYYQYTLNSDGYVTSKQTYNISGAVLTETKAYDYLVTEMGVHL